MIFNVKYLKNGARQVWMYVCVVVGMSLRCCVIHTGDNDAVLVLLLIPRLMAKCELLMTQVRDKVCNVTSCQTFCTRVTVVESRVFTLVSRQLSNLKWYIANKS